MHTRLYSIFLLLLIPSLASALGLGRLQLDSALNEPFDARIRLLSPTADELDSLEVRLADSAAFARVNMDRPAVLGRLRFRLDRAERGADTIHITSAEPIREPFLRFLIEINWSNGRLFREYTVLLDPPLYDPDKRSAELSPATTRAAPPRLEPQATVASDNPDSGRTYYSGGDYGPIRATDTLWSIANATRPSASISINQMMLALLRANPDAFITQNINGLKSGHILRMPTESELDAVGGDAEILTEVLAQHTAWQAATGAAAVADERPEPALMTADMPALSAGAPAAPDSELRLVSLDNMNGANPEGGAGGGAQDLLLAQESIESLKRENLELTDRLTENRNLIEDLQRLLSLKDSEMAALQAQLGRAEAMAAEAAAEARAAPAAASGKETLASAATEEGDAGARNDYFGALKDILTAWPLIAIVGAGLLLVLLILFLLRLRKGGEPETDILAAGPAALGADAADDAGQETGPPATAKDLAGDERGRSDRHGGQPPAAAKGLAGREASEPQQKTGPQAPKAAAAIVEEEPEEDPSRKVNTYLAFEQFEQAEEVARAAIAARPGNPEFHIKLLEVFYTSGNSGAYEEAARALHELTGGAGEHWATATAMWSEIAPDRALFAGEQAVAAPDAVVGSDAVADADEITERDAVTGVDAVKAEDEIAGAGAALQEDAATETDMVADLAEVTGADEITERDALTGVDEITGEDATVQEGEARATDEDLQDITDVTPVGALANDSGPAEEADQAAEAAAKEAARAGAEEALLDFDPAALTLEKEEITAQPVPDPDTAAGAAEISLEPAPVAEADMELDLSEFQLETDPTDQKAEADMELDLSEFDLESAATPDSGADMPAALALEKEEIAAVPVPEPDAAVGAAEISLEPAPVTAADMELDLSELQLETDPADQKAEADMEPDLSEFDLESAAAAPDSGADMPAALTLEKEEITAVPVPEPDAAAGAAEISLEPAPVAAADMELDLSELQLETDPADQKAAADMALDLSEFDLESAAATPDSGADTDFNLSELDDTPSHTTDATPYAESRPEALGVEDAAAPAGATGAGAAQLTMDDDELETTVLIPRAEQPQQQSLEDQIATQLDLARAYIEIGDKQSARGILDEVMARGSADQKRQAEALSGQI